MWVRRRGSRVVRRGGVCSIGRCVGPGLGRRVARTSLEVAPFLYGAEDFMRGSRCEVVCLHGALAWGDGGWLSASWRFDYVLGEAAVGVDPLGAGAFGAGCVEAVV